MNNIENSQERTDFMFYETFYNTIQRIKNIYGEDTAEKFTLAIIRFGVEGKELAGIDDKFLKAAKERKERKVLQAKNKSNNNTEGQNDKSSR